LDGHPRFPDVRRGTCDAACISWRRSRGPGDNQPVKPKATEGYESFVGALSATIRRSRQSAGLSQEDVAFKSGLSVRHFQKLEAGQTANPKLENLYGVATALGLALSALIGRAEKQR
jgi:ribosome-binding protein aMBF1 (putative translation factor)